jgi:hypothetical protein
MHEVHESDGLPLSVCSDRWIAAPGLESAGMKHHRWPPIYTLRITGVPVEHGTYMSTLYLP